MLTLAILAGAFIALAAVVLQEALTGAQWFGGALILSAVVLLNLPSRRPA